MNKKEKEREACEILFKQFTEWYNEVVIPHMAAMTKIWDKFKRDYERLQKRKLYERSKTKNKYKR